MEMCHECILGVIGGLGPAATVHFLNLIVQMTNAPKDQDNLDAIIYNVSSIPDRTRYILGECSQSPLPGLLSVGNALARQGAEYIAIPCMTAHYFYPELQAGIPATVINGVQETVRYLKAQGIQKAGIMATDGTIASGLFTRELIDAGILPVLPSEERQADVMHLIYRNIKAGEPAEMERFQAVRQELWDKGAEVIILGCTELSLIKRDEEIGSGFIDAMEVLAQQSILRCGKKLKAKYENLIT